MTRSKTSNAEQLELIRHHNEKLKNLLGTVPQSKREIQRIRAHQGWWRAFILGLPEGEYFDNQNQKWKNVCNQTFSESTKEDINFLTQNSYQAAKRTVEARDESNPGMIEKMRLYYNLFSSQPLCFNFFGELMADRDFGLRVLQTWWPNLTELNEVIFEFAPKERYTEDNSAFDIAFEVKIGKRKGLIGLECKYTDSFSATSYHKQAYKDIYQKSTSFTAGYEQLKAIKYNQLFRNQLIAEALIQNDKYKFVKTGLFCYHEDNSAISTAKGLQKMLKDPKSFTIITYKDFIENLQRLELDWRQREWTMLLWARYCAMILSDSVVEK